MLGICTALLLLLPAWSGTGVAQVNQNYSNLPASQTLANPSQLVQRGRDRYRSGQYAEAVTLWQQSLIAFTATGDRLNQAMVLSNLALAYQQLGQWQAANQSITDCLQLLENQELGNSSDRLRVTAQALTNQGSLLLAQGQTETSLAIWQQATQLYQQLGDRESTIRSLINQSQALRTLGLYQRASQVLVQVNQDLQSQPPTLVKVESLLSLGDIQRSIGNLKLSQAVLEQALATTQALKDSPSAAPILLSLGNTAQLQQKTDRALSYYQQALSASPSSEVALQSRLNQLRVLIDAGKGSDAESLMPTLQAQLGDLPASRTAVYAQVNYVQSLLRLSSIRTADPRQNATILAHALQQARTLGDRRAESYALGYLGQLYEQTQQFQESQKLTEQALALAQLSNATEITYRWQWQLGRILKARADRASNPRKIYPQAIVAYSEAITTLKTLRGDLVATNQDVQFSFRESVEPVYRQLVSLLLLQADTPEITQKNLKQAREVIESLQLAELDNFFREACLNATSQPVDQIDPQAAVLYPIILPDRLEVILSQPNQPLRHYSHPIAQQDLEAVINQMRRSLRRTSLETERLPVAQQLYDWLIRPAEAELATQGVKTLAFVLDGALKNLPMAALHNGKQYLVETYAIALTPGLQLLEPQSLTRKPLNVLIGGVTEASQGFSALPGVTQEVRQIQAEIPTQVLLNQDFTSKAMQTQITATPFQVVHLATHGQFSSDAENTFVLVWDQRLTVKELGDLLRTRSERDRTPIELLVLSACQTAAGDDRAALGLAGMAVRSGARSTLATLWPVDDQSTSALMVQFYQELSQGNLTRAEALRQAQLSLLKQADFKHPFYWAPFVLVGNWL